MAKEKKSNLSIVVLLVIFSFLAIILTFFQIKTNIFTPFSSKRIKNKKTIEELLLTIENKDTDKDGLSDFDEQIKYHTSIYLPDSDSDGFSDKEEIDAGSNPLNPHSTPKNKKTLNETPILEKEVSLSESSFSTKNNVDKLNDKSLTELYNKIKGNIFPTSDVDVQQIRKFLIGLGIDKNDLDKIDDETLKKAYLKALEDFLKGGSE